MFSAEAGLWPFNENRSVGFLGHQPEVSEGRVADGGVTMLPGMTTGWSPLPRFQPILGCGRRLLLTAKHSVRVPYWTGDIAALYRGGKSGLGGEDCLNRPSIFNDLGAVMAFLATGRLRPRFFFEVTAALPLMEDSEQGRKCFVILELDLQAGDKIFPLPPSKATTPRIRPGAASSAALN
jgi:hypothetical protein